ncbi:MAG: tetratricopeptide repeat protein [Candidatus Eremiobacteraeota bacterium]|nr:tetratricopeptide repeat protein [Candidatus Eremiobacteraeota bacterium]
MKSASKIMVLVMLILVFFCIAPSGANAGEEEDLYVQGNSYCMQQQWDKALESFSTLIRKYPSTRFGDTPFWVGYCQMEKGDYSQAIETFKGFISKNPNNSYVAQAMYKVGEIYEKYLCDYNKAVLAYGDVAKRFPESQVAVQSLFNNAVIKEFTQGDFSGAQRNYQKVTQIAGGNTNVYSGYKERAQQRIAFIEKNSDNGYRPLKIYTQSFALEEQKKLDKAMEGYTGLLAKYPASTLADDAQFRIMKCWEKRGVVAKVKDAGRKFLKDYPQSEYVPQVKTMLQKYGE